MVYDSQKGLKSATVGMLAFSMFMWLMVLVTPNQYRATGFQITLFFTAWGLFLAFQYWRWKAINERRQAAARGDTTLVPLAAEQPTPDEAALPLPHTIRLKHRKVQNLLACFALGGVILCFYFVYSLLTGDKGHALPYLIFAGALVIIGIPAVLLTRPRIVVTTYGLEVRGMGATGEIRWRDARLFAIRHVGKLGAPATRYELSSDSRTIAWTRLRRIRWFSLDQPALPFEEYDRQMDALLSLIAAKTGLPLYDLR